MYTILRFLSVGLILFCVGSCVYEPIDTTFTDIAPATASGLGVKVLNTEEDTVYLYTKATFKYEPISTTQTVTEVRAFIGDIQIYLLYDQTFQLDPKDYEEGTYTIRVEVTALSGSGSLSDLQEKEFVYTTVYWTLIVDKTPPTSIDLDVYKKDGTLWIEWQRYPGKNFQAYVIESYYPGNPQPTLRFKMTLTNQDQVRMRDSLYLSGERLYKITVQGSDQLGEPSSKTINYSFNADLKWARQGNLVLLTWRRHPFYANVQKYIVNTDRYRFDVANLQDTSFLFTPRTDNFSYRATLQLIYSGFGPSQYFSIQYYNGLPFIKATSSIYNRATNRYYVIGSSGATDSLYQLNGSTLWAENKMSLKSGKFALSPDGQILYVIKENLLQRIEPTTFDVIATFDFTAKFSDAIGIRDASRLLVTNNNIVVVPAGYYTTCYVFDMDRFLKLAASAYSEIYAISLDGQRYFSASGTFDRAGDKYVSISPLTPTKDLEQMEYLNADSAVAIYSGSIRIFNPADGSVINSASLSGAVGNYDRHSGKYYGYSRSSSTDNPLSIINMFDNSKTVVGLNDTQYQSYHVINNKLVCSEGYILDLQ